MESEAEAWKVAVFKKLLDAMDKGRSPVRKAYLRKYDNNADAAMIEMLQKGGKVKEKNHTSLLDKAKAAGSERAPKASAEEVEVVVAYLNGVIRLRQLMVALDMRSPSSAYTRAVSTLRQAIEAGLIKLSITEG